MAPVASKFRQAAPAIAGLAAVIAVIQLYNRRGKRMGKQAKAAFVKRDGGDGKKDADKAHVDMNFFRKLMKICRILVPKAFCAETFYMLLIAFSLLSRTYADVWMITTSTRIEAAIIDRDRQLFIRTLIHYLLSMPAISVVNNLLKFSLSELKLRFRERLTHHLYSRYLNGFTFYKMSNLDNRIANADQLLTQDVERFCEGIVELYSNLSKPLLDVGLYVAKLGSMLGFQAPGTLFAYLLVSGVFLTYLRRPVGRLTVVEQQLEGEFRFVNSRIITNSEEVAFYGGEQRERTTVLASFDRLVTHLRTLILFRFSLGFLDNIIAKYCATMIGWWTVSRPFFSKTSSLNQHNRTQLIQDYYNSGRMMYRLAEALGRLALAGREMTRLAGFTARVDTLMTVLSDLEQGKYCRTMVTSSSISDARTLHGVSSFIPGSGELVIQDHVIRFEKVPLVTPNGDVLIASLDLEVRSGLNVLVCGPNGCGKSSLFRVLGELWPLFGGRLTKPAQKNLFYVPQRPYMTLGTLRDQVIYPDTERDMERRGMTDEDLMGFLEHVQLEYILIREGGWNAIQDWMDVLSGGEKQRIAMARLFYHSPQFAILDECTSAVSMDVEGAIYALCRERGITLFTVSHRKSLWIHHDYYLHMDGRGSYEFERIDANTQQFGS